MTRILTSAEVAEIRARAEAATPKRWTVVDDSVCAELPPTRRLTYVPQSAEDLKFVAAARADVPALCDTVEALRAELGAKVARAWDEGASTAFAHVADVGVGTVARVFGLNPHRPAK